MKLAYCQDQEVACMLCDWTKAVILTVPFAVDTLVRRHLRDYHSRILVNNVEKGNARKGKVPDCYWEGPGK